VSRFGANEKGDIMRKLTVGIAAALALTSGVAVAKSKDEFFVKRANLTKQADGSWSGPGTLDGVKGTVTITGKLDPAKDAVEIRSDSEYRSKKGIHQLRWEWTAGKRLVAGCSGNRIIIRPHGVMLWDGGGRITKASAQERKYRGRAVSLYGPTKSSDLTHAQISIREANRDAVKC
jgi:hypothetical protein